MTAIMVAAITGAGLVTGLLFAFSNFVMNALSNHIFGKTQLQINKAQWIS